MEQIIRKENWKRMLPKRMDDSFKGTYGKVLIVAGSRNMAGAAYLSAKAAYRTGVGLVYIYTEECNRVILQQLLPEAVLFTWEEETFDCEQLREMIGGMDAVVAGPGLTNGVFQKQMVETVLRANNKRRLLDAGALTILAKYPQLWESVKTPIVITPHLGEMSRLTGLEIRDIKQNLSETALQFCRTHPAVTLLKDAQAIISDGIDYYRNMTGNHGMATGGSGDVLSGIIGGLLAQKMELFEAAALGAYLHGMAGDMARERRGAYSMMAGDIVEYILYGIS